MLYYFNSKPYSCPFDGLVFLFLIFLAHPSVQNLRTLLNVYLVPSFVLGWGGRGEVNKYYM